MTKVNGHLDMTSKSNKPLNKTTNISLLSMFPSYQKHKKISSFNMFLPSLCWVGVDRREERKKEF
jgi:hypothetical protein